MTKYYTKEDRKKRKLILKSIGLFVAITGFIGVAYFSFPILSYYVFLRHVYAATNLETPIPTANVLKNGSLTDAALSQASKFTGNNLANAQTWFPSYSPEKTAPRIESYTISIPKIDIENAYVSTQDYEVDKHLINYGGTAIPPEKGNAVVFGHSTLPTLYRKNDYKTIFARLHTLKVGDEVHVKASGKDYVYEVTSMDVVDPNDFRPLSQRYDGSYLTLITCTPPGTIWQRLIVKAKLVSGD